MLCLLLCCEAFAQLGMGSIKGKLTDNANGEPIPFANVIAKRNGVTILGAQTDFDGNFFLKPIDPGKYDLEASFTGYATVIKSNVLVNPDEITFQNISMSTSANLKEVVIESVKDPVVHKDGGNQSVIQMNSGSRGRSGESIAKTRSGVSTSGTSIRGSRSDGGNMVYIDGVKIRGSANLPKSALNSESRDNTESYGKVTENSFLKTSKNPLSTFSIDVDVASYANVRRMLNYGSLPDPDAVRTEEMINYFTYDYPEPTEDNAFAIYTETATCPWNTKSKLVQIGIKGKSIKADKSPPSNFVFLVDVSGSMDEPNKLPLAQQSLRMLVNNLTEKDKVAMVVYAGSSGLVLPSTNCGNKQEIISAIDRLQAGGSTAGGAGIELAYQVAVSNFIKEGNNRVILMTDGDFNVGVSNNGDLEKLISQKKETGVMLSVLGFGMGNYKDDKMEILADKGNGNYAYIDSYQEAQKVLVKEMNGTLINIAKDVKIQVEFNPALVKSYRLIGYENRLLADEDFNNDKKDAGEVGSGQTVTAIYEIFSSDENNEVDALKYQQKPTSSVPNAYPNELMTVKVRYKKPNENKSILIQQAVLNSDKSVESCSNNLKFATSVAGASLLLRNSSTINAFTFDSAIALAKNGKGPDTEGYRAEFIRLIELAKSFQNTASKQ